MVDWFIPCGHIHNINVNVKVDVGKMETNIPTQKYILIEL